MLMFQVITVFLTAVAMALSLAHALEFPGKMRLPKEAYMATQTIYYPGFTVGGSGEGLGLASTPVLVLLISSGNSAFPGFWQRLLTSGDASGLLDRHPASESALGIRTAIGWRRALVFSVSGRESGYQSAVDGDWERRRNRWEYSHIVRACFAAISLISMTIAVAIYRN